MYLDGVSRNVDPPDTVAVNEPKTSEQGVFTACPLEPLPCHQPSARQVLKPATINANAADRMCFLVIEQLAGTNKARGCNYNKGNPEKDEREPVVTAKRPGQPFELQSMFRIKRVRICHREHKQIELLNDEPECYHGDAGAHPSEKRSLVGRMITVAADHQIPHRSSETPDDECPPISAPRA